MTNFVPGLPPCGDEWRAADRAYSSMVGAASENARMARSGIGLALTKLGRLDEADAIFAALLEQPFHGPSEELLIKGRLGALRSAQGRHEEALALLRGVPESLANSPDRTRALALVASRKRPRWSLGRAPFSPSPVDPETRHSLTRRNVPRA